VKRFWNRRVDLHGDLHPVAGFGAYSHAACDIARRENEEGDMAIGVLFEAAGFTQSLYDEVLQKLNPGSSFKNLADWPSKGLLMHVAGPTEKGWRVVDVWESEADLMKFAAVLMPLLKAVGFPDISPQIFPVHKFVKT
jgi:hypothetical protein